MDLPSDIPCGLNSSNNEQEENNFRRLFEVILDTIIKQHNLSELQIEQAIISMKRSFQDYTFQEVNFKLYENLCGYLFRYAPNGAGLTRSRVLEALGSCEALASSPDLKIVSLGGGPGNDVIGLCSALHECRNEKHACLDITVVDLYEEWSVCVALAEKFVRKEKFGNVSELFDKNSVKMSFLQIKLPGDPEKNNNYFQRLQEADVILMTKLFSILDLNTVDDIIQNLSTNVKSGALILYIDAPNKVIDGEKWRDFDVLHRPKEENYYCMSIPPKTRFNSDDCFESKAQITVLRKKLCL